MEDIGWSCFHKQFSLKVYRGANTDVALRLLAFREDEKAILNRENLCKELLLHFLSETRE